MLFACTANINDRKLDESVKPEFPSVMIIASPTSLEDRIYFDP